MYICKLLKNNYIYNNVKISCNCPGNITSVNAWLENKFEI